MGGGAVSLLQTTAFTRLCGILSCTALTRLHFNAHSAQVRFGAYLSIRLRYVQRIERDWERAYDLTLRPVRIFKISICPLGFYCPVFDSCATCFENKSCYNCAHIWPYLHMHQRHRMETFVLLYNQVPQRGTWWQWQRGVTPPFFVRLTVAKSNFASITWHENRICVAPCFVKSLAISLASLPLPYSLGPLTTALFFWEKDKTCFDFPCNLHVTLFFSTEWIQSPHYISAHKNPSSTDPLNPLLAGITLPAAQCSLARGGNCNEKISCNFPWQSRYRSPMQFHPRASKLKYRQTCTSHYTYIHAFLALCIELHAARVPTKCCRRCSHPVRGWSGMTMVPLLSVVLLPYLARVVALRCIHIPVAVSSPLFGIVTIFRK